MRLSRVFFAVALLACAGAISADIAPSAAPDCYYNYKEPVPLQLDAGRIAALFREDAMPEDHLPALAGGTAEVTDMISTGVGKWELLELRAPLADAHDVNDRASSLIANPAIQFVTPVFQKLDGGWIIMLPEILLRFVPDARHDAVSILADLAPGARIVDAHFGGMDGACRIHPDFQNGFDVLALANRLAQDDRVAWAHPDMQCSVELPPLEETIIDPDHQDVMGRDGFGGPIQPVPETDILEDQALPGRSFIPNDPYFADQWAMRNTGQFGGVPGYDMDGDLAWDITTGSPDIKVLIMDCGVQQDHPDINQLPGYDFALDLLGGGPRNECDDHGTLVAGCVSALVNNSLGVVGIAPSCKVVSARVFVSAIPCSNTGTVQASWMVDALDWGEREGVQITSASLGLTNWPAMHDKYDETYANGMVHFASAGNDNSAAAHYPSDYSSVNSVAAISSDGEKAWFSNYGSKISICTPGESIYTTDRTGSDGRGDGDYVCCVWGTSFASPHAAGIAALILSADPSLTPAEVEEKIRCSARDIGISGWDQYYGYGLANAYRAVSAALGVDTDGDGVDDPCDNCPDDLNADQADTDVDGIGDVCDACPDDWYNDRDADGVCGNVDNCPNVANPGQEDTDGDGIGDVCECHEPNYTFTGSAANSMLGLSFSVAGDVNNDGIDDIMIGRQFSFGSSEYGSAYVYSGEDYSLLYELHGDEADDWFGYAVSFIGDLNDDGFDDMLVGAPFNDGNGADAGRVYIFLGSAGPFPVSLYTSDAYRIVTGEIAGDNQGTAVGAVPDIDEDGVNDIFSSAAQYISGGAGLVYFYSGQTGDFIRSLPGESAYDVFGICVADAGDVNNDDVADIVVGASQELSGGSGKAYVYSGVDGTELFQLAGEYPGDLCGFRVSGAGDTDGDGFDDVLVGAMWNDEGGPYAGKTYLYSGEDGTLIRSHIGQTGDQNGAAIAGLGDIDGDTYADYAVGSYFAGVSVYSGLTGDLIYRYLGEEPRINFGEAVIGGSDFDGDGVADMIVGAPSSDVGAESAGQAFVYLLGDVDEDGIFAGCDNCPLDYNPDQADADDDGIGDACACDCGTWGDVNDDGNINPVDVVYLVNFVYKNQDARTQPPNCPYEAGDVDCNEQVNPVDIVYYVNYVYKDQKAFCEPCP